MLRALHSSAFFKTKESVEECIRGLLFQPLVIVHDEDKET